MANQVDIKTSIKEEVDKYWDANKEPFLLSSIGSIYPKEDIQAYTKGVSLRNWIDSNRKELGVQVVVHPLQPARIGLIPLNETYTFSKTTDSKKNTDRELTLAFLEMLNTKLSSKELDEINIPFKILTKLLK